MKRSAILTVAEFRWMMATGRRSAVASPTPSPVSVQVANDIHRLVMADSAFFWEGGKNGCFARALLVVDRMEGEGLPRIAIGKLQVVHKDAPLKGWDMQTRLAGTQSWIQHVVATVETTVGLYIVDPILCDTAEPERQWLNRFPLPGLNPVGAPSQRFLQALLGSSDVAFEQLLALAANRPHSYKHLLNNPAVAARLEQLGSPVRSWLERRGPVAEKFDDHLIGLSSAADQAGPVVRGEIIRVAYGTDFFTDVFWDTAGPHGVRGMSKARDYLDQLRDEATP
jgi:hypothetical protein